MSRSGSLSGAPQEMGGALAPIKPEPSRVFLCAIRSAQPDHGVSPREETEGWPSLAKSLGSTLDTGGVSSTRMHAVHRYPLGCEAIREPSLENHHGSLGPRIALTPSNFPGGDSRWGTDRRCVYIPQKTPR